MSTEDEPTEDEPTEDEPTEDEPTKDAHASLGRVQRIDGPTLDQVVLGLYHPQAGRRLLSFDARRHALEWLDERLSGLPADGFVRRLRNLLTGATAVRAEALGSRRRLVLRIRDGSEVLLSDHEHAPCLRRASDGFPLAGRRRFASALEPERWSPIAIETRTSSPTTTPTPRRDELERRLDDERRRLERRIAAIEADARRAEQVDRLRDDASFILASLHHAIPGAKVLEADDSTSDPPRSRHVALDPTRSAAEHAARLFHQARRLERGAAIAHERLQAAQTERTQLAAWAAALARGERDRVEEALRQRRAPASRGGGGERSAPRRPYRVFLGDGDRPIHVGRSAADNDTLTLSARPHDRWLHVRARTGSHVVVPLTKNEDCAPALLADAAHLAAHFSDARGDDRVEIQHADRRHIHKRKGAAPGAVVVTHDKTLLLRVDPDRLRWLLSRER